MHGVKEVAVHDGTRFIRSGEDSRKNAAASMINKNEIMAAVMRTIGMVTDGYLAEDDGWC